MTCLVDSSGNCAGNYQEFLEAARTALLFRVSILKDVSDSSLTFRGFDRKCFSQLNQIESIDNKVRRMKKFKKVVENKVEKVTFFENVTEILLEAMGK